MEKGGMVHVYFSDVSVLSSEQAYAQCYSALTPQRRQKADHLSSAKDRMLSVGAGCVLQYALLCEGVPDNAATDVTQRGKPYLPQYPNMQFNLSHSERYVMCAVSAKGIGCDIQLIKPYDKRIAQRFFTAGERDYIESRSGEKEAAFAEIWTRKESLAKATGKGLSQFYQAIGTADRNGLFSSVEMQGAQYRFLELHEIGGYGAACCVEGAETLLPTAESSCELSYLNLAIRCYSYDIYRS